MNKLMPQNSRDQGLHLHPIPRSTPQSEGDTLTLHLSAFANKRLQALMRRPGSHAFAEMLINELLDQAYCDMLSKQAFFVSGSPNEAEIWRDPGIRNRFEHVRLGFSQEVKRKWFGSRIEQGYLVLDRALWGCHLSVQAAYDCEVGAIGFVLYLARQLLVWGGRVVFVDPSNESRLSNDLFLSVLNSFAGMQDLRAVEDLIQLEKSMILERPLEGHENVIFASGPAAAVADESGFHVAIRSLLKGIWTQTEQRDECNSFRRRYSAPFMVVMRNVNSEVMEHSAAQIRARGGCVLFLTDNTQTLGPMCRANIGSEILITPNIEFAGQGGFMGIVRRRCQQSDVVPLMLDRQARRFAVRSDLF